jgi:hypothetical protein
MKRCHIFLLNITCIKRSPLGTKKKWSLKTADLLTEVQFIWTTCFNSVKNEDLLQVTENQWPAASQWQPTTCCKSLTTNDLLQVTVIGFQWLAAGRWLSVTCSRSLVFSDLQQVVGFQWLAAGCWFSVTCSRSLVVSDLQAASHWQPTTCCKSLKTNDLLQVTDNQRPAANHWKPMTFWELLNIFPTWICRVHLAIGEILIFSASMAVAILVA